jgi:hypothetical protein
MKRGASNPKPIQKIKSKIATRVREESTSPTNEEVLSDPDEHRKKGKSKSKTGSRTLKMTAGVKPKAMTKNTTFSDEKHTQIEKSKPGDSGVSILEFLTPQAATTSTQLMSAKSSRAPDSIESNEFVSSLVYTNPFNSAGTVSAPQFAAEKVSFEDVSGGDAIGSGPHGDVYKRDWKENSGCSSQKMIDWKEREGGREKEGERWRNVLFFTDVFLGWFARSPFLFLSLSGRQTLPIIFGSIGVRFAENRNCGFLSFKA